MNFKPLHTLFYLMFFALLLVGCGKKIWPQPQADEDTFSWKNPTFTRDGDCLRIKTQIAGNHYNLLKLALEIEQSEQNCQVCPFRADRSIPIALSSPSVLRKGAELTVQICELPSSALRWRLIGYNVYKLLEPVQSKVFFASALTAKE